MPESEQEEIGVGYTDNRTGGGGDGDLIILPPGQHTAVLKTVQRVRRKKFQSSEEEDQILFTFESLQWKDPETGLPGIISQWTGLVYGNEKSKMTLLLEQIFCRELTPEEAERLSLSRLSGQIKGFVLVGPHTKQDGAKTSKFSSFIHPLGRPVPKPYDFFKSSTKPASGETPIQTDDLDDPFGPGDPFGDEG